MQSTVTLVQDMHFDAELAGHHFPIDATSEHGGTDRGPGPKGLLLSALAGCAAMDIISILRKMRVPPTTLDVTAEGTLTDAHPIVLEAFIVTVRAAGDVPPAKLWRAVALSRDRYCGVAEMLRAHSTISFQVELNGQPVPEPTA